MALRWYVVHAYSNFEHRVAESLKERIQRAGLGERFGEILVPTEEVVEMRDGQKRKSERKFYPGYVLASQATWIRWLPVIAGLVLAAVVVALSRYGSEFRRFLELARIELRKVVWPTRQETLQTTLVVFGFVIIAGIFFWLLDLALAWATKALTGTGG